MAEKFGGVAPRAATVKGGFAADRALDLVKLMQTKLQGTKSFWFVAPKEAAVKGGFAADAPLTAASLGATG